MGGDVRERPADGVDQTAVPDDRRAEDPLRRQRQLVRADGPAHQSVAGEHLRVAPTWAELAGHARLFAVDLPGFGASEGRQELMSARAMGAFPGTARCRG